MSAPGPVASREAARGGQGTARVLARLRALNWRTICMGLPKRRFTSAELQRAVPDPPSASLRVGVALNVALPVMSAVWSFAGHAPVWFTVVLAAAWLGMLLLLEVVWRDPSLPVVRWSYYIVPLLLGLMMGWHAHGAEAPLRYAAAATAGMVMMAAIGLWFGIVYRHQYIVMRLRELDEQALAIDMARQLATAQIQPHFLFNSLASLQHWVHGGDPRAAPLLDSLTAYLRATLPLFERQHLTVAQELEAVRRYLEVMQARLGERLRFEIDLQEAAGATPLPPGLLLTLVENAIEHGVQPLLAGGRVRVAAWQDGDGRTVVEVRDDGPGVPPDVLAGAPSFGGLGLSNTRQRLAQAFGERATLQLDNPPEGGCLARVTLPAVVSDTVSAAAPTTTSTIASPGAPTVRQASSS